MKIGKFGEVNNLSIDTIRHYMDLSLIIPEKKGGHYFFDEYCQTDLELIIHYKDLGFSLNEIKELFFYKNLAKSMNYEKDIFYQSLFKLKYDKMEQEIELLEKKRDKLKGVLHDLLLTNETSNTIIGIDLSILHLLTCSKCRQKLILQDGIINNNQITEGKLICNCGEEYIITSGIITAGKSFKANERTSLEDTISDYIHETDNAYLENMLKEGEWAKKKLIHLDLNNKLILDIGSGLGFFLRSIYEELPEDCLYIAVDRDFNKLLFLKDVLARKNPRRNILFICADFLNIPIQNRSVDIVIDHSGTSNYSFEHADFLLHELNPLFKSNCYLLSLFILFENFSLNSQITNNFRANFSLSKIKKEIQNLQFQSIDESTSNYLKRGGKYEDFFVQGEEIYTYSFFGKRWG
ncbi:MerR family transcriptional regulator [Bacillus paranthracis]|uniref:MerR family transcriptional regulator n=1 Tax=Bacillus cereus group TaxID=86661 RepID=UPI000937C4CB|nr:methyltransferase domain-containing protein [Bacillus paranthracis]MBE7134178.1 MerR family transcriptional regulator [Bacillus paranthracis]MBE7156677.1 MerR family transcriptional regulator [Bacillus paranthracis]MCC2371891.1 methyltransferase domain-containing protein [Bacillus paranthracis]MDK7537644.1 methyltransferase domain-containing protein [Bacillus paranthracis]MDK7558614.1 methyltransferase domain-containing protein [Bacillus paranthracis]